MLNVYTGRNRLMASALIEAVKNAAAPTQLVIVPKQLTLQTERMLLEKRFIDRMGQRETAKALGVSQMQISRMYQFQHGVVPLSQISFTSTRRTATHFLVAVSMVNRQAFSLQGPCACSKRRGRRSRQA